MPKNSDSPSSLTPITIDPSINGWNAEYIEHLMVQWKANPESVDDAWQQFFQGFELGSQQEQLNQASVPTQVGYHQANVDSLIYNYRAAGHYAAQLDPLKIAPTREDHLELQTFGLSKSQLSEPFDPGHLYLPNPSTLQTIIDSLETTYCKHIGVEYAHIEDREQRRWLQQSMEPNGNQTVFSESQKENILRQLIEATTLEHFCATRYIGKKRFSLEGNESLIPMMHALINYASEHEVEVVNIGMAHRGRINVLVNILKKSYDQLFTEFEESWIEDFVSGGGDVKYHLGYSSEIMTDCGKPVHVTLSANPSHLEFGHSVVLGKARAKQRTQHDEDRRLCIPLLIHGDASFPGQGIVAEMFNMAHLDGYTVGGTIHFVVNNQIGFTTNPHDSYSGRYCTDIAKMAGAPILHVNGYDPEACVHAVKLAVAYRQTFHNDIVIDLWGYRQHGHNESDEPAYTQPQMYEKIRQMKSVTEDYAEQLIASRSLSQDTADLMTEEVRSELDASQIRTKENPVRPHIPPYQKSSPWEGLKGDPTHREVDTTVTLGDLSNVANAMSNTPDGFNIHRKLKKLVAMRTNVINERGSLDWGTAELFAYGTLLNEGSPVRLTGQDVERGTFSHRHAVYFDAENGTAFSPLNAISDGQAKMCIHNSPLTENAVLGFEYGYSLGDPQMLVIWEAQFGDFANGAQVIIDQFIASAEMKWKRASGLVLLLPHGYEGQGPEHSSARLERFLTLCANQNMSVINPTTPSQIFHALRRQIKWNFRKPLIVMSPKSLLRHPEAISPIHEFTDEIFKSVIDDATTAPEKVNRVLFCSGKIYYDLAQYRRKLSQEKTVAIVRIEELYPFPQRSLDKIIQQYANAEFMFVQEEPENMGAWQYVDEAFRDELGRELGRVCRSACASPAVASSKMHNIEQQRILIEALGLPQKT